MTPPPAPRVLLDLDRSDAGSARRSDQAVALLEQMDARQTPPCDRIMVLLGALALEAAYHIEGEELEAVTYLCWAFGLLVGGHLAARAAVRDPLRHMVPAGQA